MRRWIWLSLLILASFSVSDSLWADPDASTKLPSLRIIEDFSDSNLDKFPENFHTYPFQKHKAIKVYVVRSESDNRFLAADDSDDISVQIFKKFYWEAERWPYFSWKWRARTLPQGAAENDSAANDSACGVYVVFGGYGGRALKYVWSTTLPVNSVFPKKKDNFYFIVLRSGSGRVGQWETETVNVWEDYRRIFNEDPKRNPSGFGLLTDGNATHTPASCDYDDFKISENPL